MRWAPLVFVLSALGCEARLAVGATCTYDSECPAPLVCRYQRCRTECLTSRDCPFGLRCIAMGAASVCTVAQEETCGGDDGCAPPLTCPDGRCRLSCTTASDCGTSAVCGTASFCIEAISDGHGGRPETEHGSLCAAGACASGFLCDDGDTCTVAGVAATCRADCGGATESCPWLGPGIACRCSRCSAVCDPVTNTGCGDDVCTLYPYGGSVSFTDCRAIAGPGVAGTRCTEDEECAAEHVCFGGRGCVELCRSDTDCRNGETCRFDYIPPRFDEATATIGGCGDAPG